VKLGAVFHRTEVCPKTLNPVWDSQWLKFTVSSRGKVEREREREGGGVGECSPVIGMGHPVNERNWLSSINYLGYNSI